MKLHVSVAIFLALSLTACGGESGGAGQVDQAAVEAIGDGLEPGDYQLEVDGSVRVTGASGDERGPYEFRPSTSKDGTNAEGPYNFRVRAMTERDSEEIMAYAMFTVPAGTVPGTYPLTSSRAAGDDDAYAMLRATEQAWNFAKDVDGTLTIGELGNHLSAKFDFEAADGEGEKVEVRGRMFRVPFSPQPEATATITVNGESEKFSGRARFMSDSLIIGPLRGGLTFPLTAALESGTHQLQLGRDGDGIRVNLPIDADTLDGRISLERDGEYLHGDFDLEAKGDDDTLEADGQFEFLKVD